MMPWFAVSLPWNSLLIPALGESFWFAPKVNRSRTTASLVGEHFNWIPAINGGIELVYDQLNYR